MALTKALGGGGSTLTAQYSAWDPFVPDTSPHADTDEFDDSATISDWTGIYTGDASVVNDIATTAERGMYFEAPSVQYRLRSRMKAIIAGDFTIHTAIAIGGRAPPANTIIGGGILLANGTTAAAGSQTAAIVARHGSFTSGALKAYRLTWANYGNDATSAAADSDEWAADIAFLRVRRVSTTYYMAVSPNGENEWAERSITLLGGFTPTHVGLTFQNYGGVGTASMLAYYFRVYATGTQYKTGSARTVYG
jgi:hypothetical protein